MNTFASQNNACVCLLPLIHRVHYRSLLMTSLKPSSAPPTEEAPCRWQLNTCLTSWTNRQTNTASTTRMYDTHGRATGEFKSGLLITCDHKIVYTTVCGYFDRKVFANLCCSAASFKASSIFFGTFTIAVPHQCQVSPCASSLLNTH